MADRSAANDWERKVGRATGRMLLARDHYATVAITCRMRAQHAPSARSSEQLSQDYLARTTRYALVVGRSLANGGIPPARIEVDSECELDGSEEQPRVARLVLSVRANPPVQDDEPLLTAAFEATQAESVWDLPETATVEVAAALLSSPEHNDVKEVQASPAEPRKRGLGARRLALRLAVVLLLLAAVAMLLLSKTIAAPGRGDKLQADTLPVSQADLALAVIRA